MMSSEVPVKKDIFEREFDRYRREIDEALELCDWDNKTADITHSGFKHLGTDARELAAYHLVRGEVEMAIDLYRKAAITYHTSAIARTGEADLNGSLIYGLPFTYADSILLAILADERDLATQHAEATLEMPTKWPAKNPEFKHEESIDLPPKRVAYARALAAVVLDETGRARKFLEDLQAPVPEEYRGNHVYDNEARKPFYEHVHTALTGILEADPHAISHALERYLQEVHEDGWRWASEVEWATNAYHVTALLKLAHWKGVDVNFESEYVPTDLIDLLE